VPLRIVGDGPMRAVVEAAIGPKIAASGWKTGAEIVAEMGQAAFLVLPSEYYESFPMVIVEAFSQGLPVIASRIGALAEIVEDGRTGLLFSVGDAEDLARKVQWAGQHPEALRRMGAEARWIYEERYSPSVNFRQLTEIYEEAITHNRVSAIVGRNLATCN